MTFLRSANARARLFRWTVTPEPTMPAIGAFLAVRNVRACEFLELRKRSVRIDADTFNALPLRAPGSPWTHEAGHQLP